MKSFFDAGVAGEIRERLGRLRADSPRQWGKMDAAQMLAHLCKGMEQASGAIRPPRMLIGRLLGGMIRGKALGDDAPMRRNSPTVPGFVVADAREFEAERGRLEGLIERAEKAGLAGCTEHPHSFFGRLTGEEWGVLMWKHLDHHLRQFGV